MSVLPIHNSLFSTTVNSSERMDIYDVPFLPNEILLGIMSFASEKALYNLCLTSKGLNALAQPILYQTFEQVDNVPYWPYLRTLIARPDLASQVTDLRICDWEDINLEFSAEAENTAKGPGEGKSWKEVQDVQIARLMSHLWEGLETDEHDMGYSHSEKELVLLLSLTHNLERLSLMLTSADGRLERAMEHAKSSLKADRPLLTKLNTLDLDWWDMEGGFHLDLVSPFLELPSLTTLSADRCVDGPSREPRSLNLQRIRLTSSFLADDEIVKLVRACKALKSFKLDFDSSVEEVLGRFDFRRVGRALGNDLEAFVLDWWDPMESESWPTVTSSIGSLEHLENLRRLDLPQCALFGRRDDSRWHAQSHATFNEDEDGSDGRCVFVNQFPRGLRNLVIQVCSPNIIKHLWFCCTHRMEILPNLRRLTVTGNDIYGHAEMPKLKEAFKEVGVIFRYPFVSKPLIGMG